MTEFALVHNSVSEQSVNDPETSIPKFTPFFLLYAQFLLKKTCCAQLFWKTARCRQTGEVAKY